MCGRYSNRFDGRKLVVRYQVSNLDFKWLPNINVAPTQFSPVVVIREGRRILKSMKWGLIPPWAKDPKIGAKCFNARAETVADKPAFRDSFKTKRCLVPADAFYEWRVEEEYRKVTREEKKQTGIKESELPTGKKRKQPYRFTIKGEKIFSLAGLWASWRNPWGEEIESFTILTTEPNNLLAQYHNRMPVILLNNIEQIWADPQFTNKDLLIGLLKPLPENLMIADQVQEKLS